MSLLSWIFFGLLAGFIGSKIVSRRGMGIILDTIVGMIGAVIGGYVFNHFGETGVTGFNLWSLGVAVVGSVLLLTALHLVRRIAR